ncbi:hypothetical protein [Streptomyces sp. NPDC048350]|uniref:hypothetical protein n=1 Tax=Streptomyces sp. NPDC048350 TaxID=3365538 RepID=UPI00371E902C
MLASLSLAFTSFAVPATAQASAVPARAELLALPDAIELIQIADESRAGFQRDSFRHWNTGLDKTDGCNTRSEVLLDEATEAPGVATGCRTTTPSRCTPRPVRPPSSTTSLPRSRVPGVPASGRARWAR